MEPESERAFTSGNATYMRNWPYVYALAKESKIADKFQVSTFPSYGGSEGAGVIGGYNLAISSFSKNPEGSLAFINSATSPEAQEIQATKASLPAVLTQTYDDPQVKEALPFAAELLDAAEQAKPRPVTPVYPQVTEAIYNNVFDVLQGNASPDDAASKMNDDIQKALETF
jgi:multiple sugar transport system substrate-binding protein